MAAVINTNYLSLVAQNNLTKSQSTLGSAIERLSSGLRINSAKDDAAGQAIANRFTANVKGLTQAARNANDGISIAQTTEGALNEINNNLQRVRQLTVQATSGTNSPTDLQSIQSEIKLRLDEIDRVSAQTQFNGVKVLASDQGLSIQVGANDNETITIDLKEITSSTLGLGGFSVANSAPSISKKVTELGDGTGAPVAVDLTAVATSLSASTGKTVNASDLSLHNILDANGNATAKYGVKLGDDVYAVDISAAGAVTAVTSDLTVTQGSLTGTVAAAAVKLAADGTSGYVTYGGKNYATTATTGTATGTTINTATTPEFAGATTANPLAKLDAALANVDTLRSNLGAIQNRFESTVANLNNTVNNLSAARSRIEDADYATEVSNMTKAQILQQAGTSVLAQANQVPQTVLSLLR
ncbi:FliC/FljB family flagellin [Achromobacter sp. ACM01]|uniref:FliC/FljB family flagellin n=1 Tax=Achromobacter sp. ACM01 TaxID=2769298 RepID=UPI001786E315|nr:FliC/FljB family flagellin [Achromobacter sp. ACM01]MBD9473210.1 FliC/FljB family flagellin [Achromobacter sp. ACM01]